MPDNNQNLIIRVLLLIFVCMFIANTLAQFMQISYKEPFYLATWLLPLLVTVVYAFYKKAPTTLKTLLVIEDKEFWRSILKTFLHDQYKIVFCKSGEEAIAWLRNAAPVDMPEKAVIDMHLPGMQGIELIRQITELGLDIDITILSVREPDLNSDEQKFVDMWMMKVPETFRGTSGLFKALQHKQPSLIDTAKDTIKKLLPIIKK